MKFWKAMGHSLFSEDESARKTVWILRVVFFFYLLALMKVIVFKYPLSELAQITSSWTKEVILEGLDTANFTLFKTIDMYIRYWGRLNSFENLFGNIFCFVPFGFLLPFLHRGSRKWPVLLLDSFLLVCSIDIFQLITNFGAFDVDDILLNCVGSMGGYCLFAFCFSRWERGRKK